MSALFKWAMASIPVGWPPANLAAANMQIPAWTRGDRRLTSLSATLEVCGMSLEETMGVSSREAIMASESLREACRRDYAPVFKRTALLVFLSKGI